MNSLYSRSKSLVQSLETILKPNKHIDSPTILDIIHPSVIINSSTDPGQIQNAGFKTIGDGRKTVAVAGTAEVMSSASQPIKHIFITAETNNTGVIAVGGSTVVAAEATRRGTHLNAGDTMDFPISNLNLIYLDTTVNTDGVTYTYLS